MLRTTTTSAGTQMIASGAHFRVCNECPLFFQWGQCSLAAHAGITNPPLPEGPWQVLLVAAAAVMEPIPIALSKTNSTTKGKAMAELSTPDNPKRKPNMGPISQAPNYNHLVFW